MHAYIYPGQGTQFPGMGKSLFDKSKIARELFYKANDILGFSISDIMFEGTAEDLKQTKITQPAIFLHSFILTNILGKDFKPDMVAGHSLGEITALAVAGVLDFESALRLIFKRASTMNKVCEVENTGMAVIVGLYDVIVENICKQVNGIVVPANYNTLKQVVISGDLSSIEEVKRKTDLKGVKVVNLPVSGAFHSPYMNPVIDEFKSEIEGLKFNKPSCPVYQNVTARPSKSIPLIKRNLINQLIMPVKWRHSVLHMIEDGAVKFTEVGPGNFLSSTIRKIDSKVNIQSVSKFIE